MEGFFRCHAFFTTPRPNAALGGFLPAFIVPLLCSLRMILDSPYCSFKWILDDHNKVFS